jgi:hypothetical protein
LNTNEKESWGKKWKEHNHKNCSWNCKLLQPVCSGSEFTTKYFWVKMVLPIWMFTAFKCNQFQEFCPWWSDNILWVIF